MPHKGFYTQGISVLFDAPVSLPTISGLLEDHNVVKTVEENEEWSMGGPTVVIPFRPEVNGYVSIDTVDRPWPDGMGDPKNEGMLFAAWSMGHFGPFAYPGNLQRATQQSWHWDEGKTLPLGNRAFARVRSSYIFGADRESPVLPSDYNPFEELLFVTKIARDVLRLPGAICYFNPNGETVFPASAIDNLIRRHEREGFVPLELWANVRLFNLEGHDPWVLMDTVGMWQLDIPDHEAAFRADRYDPSEVAGFLRNAADYVFTNGQVINDCDTMDGPGSARWQAATFEEPICDPPREVLRWIPRDGSVPPHEITDGKAVNDRNA
jgi:hypothetical protein